MNDTVALELLLEDYLDQIRELVKQAKGSEPDLSGIAAAITTLRYPTPEEIAQAIAKVVRFPAPTDLTPMLERVAKAMENLEKQRPHASPVGFGNSKVEIRNVEHFKDIKRGITDYETRLDYGARTDDQPVYVGRAPQDTATSAADWYIERISYDASNRPTRSERLSGSWDNRGSL